MEDKFVKYTVEAMDDILNGNTDAGNEKLDTSIKFFQDQKYIHPQVFSRASKRINDHLLEILFTGLEDTLISYQKLVHLMKVVLVVNLMFYNFITDALVIYQKNNNESDLKMAIECINDLKNINIRILNMETFNGALTEFDEIMKEDPSYPDYKMFHKESVNNLKKTIHNYDKKSDKKNNKYKRLHII